MLENIRKQCGGRRLRSVGVHNVDKGARHSEAAQIRTQHGIQLARNKIEARLRENAREFRQHQWMRRENTNLERSLLGRTFHSRCRVYERPPGRQAIVPKRDYNKVTSG